MDEVKVYFDMDSSVVKWGAFKVGGQHHGTLKFKSGYITMVDGKPTGGEGVVDMTTLADEDLTGDMNALLIKDLGEKQFFDVATYPESKIENIVVTPKADNSGYDFKGDLIIKGKTNPIQGSATATEKDGVFTIQTDKLELDRELWDIGTPLTIMEKLGSHLIKKIFEMEVTIVTKKS